jgi:hypothetical protein
MPFYMCSFSFSQATIEYLAWPTWITGATMGILLASTTLALVEVPEGELISALLSMSWE